MAINPLTPTIGTDSMASVASALPSSSTIVQPAQSLPPLQPDTISRSASAVAAHDGERGPALFMLSGSEQQELESGRAQTSGHGWHDDAQTGALLLRANASPAYVARYLSPQHLSDAEQLDAARDRRADAPLIRAVSSATSTVTGALRQPRDVVQSVIAGRPSLRPDAATADANRQIVRERVASALAHTPDSASQALGAAFGHYDSLPQAARGTLDAALDTATDPLTYASFGADAVAGVAARVASQAPKILEAIGDLGSGATRLFDGGLTPAAAGIGPVGSLERTSISDAAKFEARRSVDTIQPARRTYEADEAAGGHTIEMHIGKSDEQLRTRLKNDDRLQAASTFTTMATASKARGAFEKAYSKEIERWKSTSHGDPFIREVDVGSPIGRVLQRGRDNTDVSTTARFVLLRDNSEQGFHILSAYPILK